MSNTSGLNENSPSVQSHLTIMQSVIQRMATNSSSCKTWCITLVSAILVVVADKGKPSYTLISLIPTFLFMMLDAYYLSLEKMFRESYKIFVEKLHNGRVVAEDLYAVSPSGNKHKMQLASLMSLSVWPFYTLLFLMVLVVKYIVMPNIAVIR